jgi:hypothetical protein
MERKSTEIVEFDVPVATAAMAEKSAKMVKKSTNRYNRFKKSLKTKGGYSTYNGKRVRVTRIETIGG